MHPNAEIGYLTQDCQTLFNTFMDVSGGSGGGGGKKDDTVMTTLQNYEKTCPKNFDIHSINDKIKEKIKGGPITPFIVVALQETERMNGLLSEIKNSLEDLKLGLTGALNITDAMETLG